MTAISDDVDVTDEVDDEADAAPVASRRARLRGWVRRARRWTAIVAAAAVLAAALFEGWLLFQQHRSDVAARAALDAARSYAVTLTTADPATIDHQITAIIDNSTGDFHDRYTKHSAELRGMLLANKVTTRGKVVDSAVKSVTPQQVTVLLFVKQTFTSAALPEWPDGQPGDPPPDVTSMAVTLQKVDHRWLVSNVVPAEQLG
ncbi:Mce protein [Mycobacterium sp. pUA109]|uniref:Mce protein n=1 Tax=Mycobacterium sp. pUA109 TaxID=3238982 RepID=UPI00351BD244